MPPLSFVDKSIYWTIMLILCVMYLALLFGPLFIRDKIAFADEMVIAKEDNISYLWLLVPWMTFFLMTFILWLMPYQRRIPIFGLRNFKYGPPAWPKIYPLFMKNKPYVWVSKRAEENRKKIAALLLTILLVSFIPLPWALYGRNCLRADGGIEQYSMFNSKTKEFSSGQIASVEFETYRYHTGKHVRRTHWGIQVALTTDGGRTYTFRSSEFRHDWEGDIPYWLTAMLRLKNRYDPQIIRYGGMENLNEVISDENLTDVETEMLYQLFGIA